MTYKAPVRDTMFVLQELAGLEAIAAIPGFEAADADTAQAIVDECAKLCEGVIAPLNAVGNKQPASWEGGVVRAPRLASRRPTWRLPRAAGKACSIRKSSAVRVCPRRSPPRQSMVSFDR
jgi:Acyl-CoA dehydrogenase N terminal